MSAGPMLPASDVRWRQRFSNYKLALQHLEEAAAIASPSPLERSGLIQAFEMTFELAWKTLQDLLFARGYPDISGPRPVL